ncbi:MAG TPA: adenylate/guanylate cyclase domain-containing protein [Acidimicrobiales bacterium]|nr:adenylate/guanylate cyclase domain-containing protein [Acidimicrobiales bacterium]
MAGEVEGATGAAGHSPSKRVGRRAVRDARKRLLQRALDSMNPRDREVVARLTERGPGGRAAQVQVVEELLERAVERHPSLLGTVGLSAIQAISGAIEEASEEASLGTSRPLSVVFTDLEGFTEWTAREGDEAASRLLSAHHEVVRPIISGRGGRLVKRLGDGLLLTFSQPEAAVLACLELVDAQPAPLRLRAGVHMGQVVVMRDDVIGHVVNLTARVAEAAEGSEVLATHDVTRAVALPNVRFGDTRDERFKGIEEPIRICAVNWA